MRDPVLETGAIFESRIRVSRFEQRVARYDGRPLRLNHSPEHNQPADSRVSLAAGPPQQMSPQLRLAAAARASRLAPVRLARLTHLATSRAGCLSRRLAASLAVSRAAAASASVSLSSDDGVLQLYNTLTRTKEPFSARPGQARGRCACVAPLARLTAPLRSGQQGEHVRVRRHRVRLQARPASLQRERSERRSPPLTRASSRAATWATPAPTSPSTPSSARCSAAATT